MKPGSLTKAKLNTKLQRLTEVAESKLALYAPRNKAIWPGRLSDDYAGSAPIKDRGTRQRFALGYIKDKVVDTGQPTSSNDRNHVLPPNHPGAE